MRLAVVASILLTMLALAACSGSARAVPSVTATQPPLPATPSPPVRSTTTAEETSVPALLPEVRAYLDEALDILQTHSVYRQEVDWPAFHARVNNVGRNTRTVSDAHQVLQLALMWIDDDHTNFMTPSQAEQFQKRTHLRPGPDPEGRLVDARFGYILLPGFATDDEDLSSQFAATVQDLIQTVDSESPCGWIVDLRTNDGGNMWPRCWAGVGPICGRRTGRGIRRSRWRNPCLDLQRGPGAYR